MTDKKVTYLVNGNPIEFIEGRIEVTREIKIQMIKDLLDKAMNEWKNKMNRVTYLNEPIE